MCGSVAPALPGSKSSAAPAGIFLGARAAILYNATTPFTACPGVTAMNPLRILLVAGLLSAVLLLGGCRDQEPAETAPPAPAPAAAPTPPTPPLRETFDGEPQLSLFPRTGAARPTDDSDEFGYWSAFIDHIQRTSGVGNGSGSDGSRAWTIRGIKGLDSIAFFSPLAVTANTGYRVAFDFKGELPKGAKAGIGVLEFARFLWIGEQFTLAQLQEHQTGLHPGIALTGNQAWQRHTFTFTTSPRTGMIHLILFRDGAMDREKPVWFDNIVIEEAPR